MNEMNHLPKKGEIVSEYKGVKVFQLTPEEFNQVTGRRKYERGGGGSPCQMYIRQSLSHESVLIQVVYGWPPGSKGE